ncbi:MAG: hypothetical protein Kow0069_15760 [Promethearchaeota archaeon]
MPTRRSPLLAATRHTSPAGVTSGLQREKPEWTWESKDGNAWHNDAENKKVGPRKVFLVVLPFLFHEAKAMVPPNFCWQCGARVYEGQVYCERCGTRLAAEEPPEAPAQGRQGVVEAPAPAASPEIRARQRRGTGKLFDPSREFYVLHEKYWDWGSGDIFDERGDLIGTMHRRWFSLRGVIELKEVTGEVAATIHRKILSIRQTYDLKDSRDRLLARFNRAILAIIHPRIYVEDPSGRMILEGRGNFVRWDFRIHDAADGHVVAEVHKLDRWQDVFLGGAFDFSDQYAVRVVDPGVDRRLVVGMALAIDNSLHDDHGRRGIGMHNAAVFGRTFGRRAGWR